MKKPLFYRRYIGTTSYANGCSTFVDISRRIPAGLHFLRDPATVGSNQPGQQGPTQTHGTALPPTLSYLGGWIIILTGSNRKKKSNRGQISIPRPTDSRETLPSSPRIPVCELHCRLVVAAWIFIIRVSEQRSSMTNVGSVMLPGLIGLLRDTLAV